jgi:hypothetical protein
MTSMLTSASSKLTRLLLDLVLLVLMAGSLAAKYNNHIHKLPDPQSLSLSFRLCR